MAESKSIFIKGARVNNLKNVDLEIPRGKFVVITGVSGSGKSSLAFDTLYAEGQRRYVESLSSYARQFLGRMHKPECDYIKGIPPAIAIRQRVGGRNPRSTVGTTTEVYEYLRLLFARIGKTISPISGKEVKRHYVADVVDQMLTYPPQTRIMLLTKIILRDGRNVAQQLDMLFKEGFSRIEVDGQTEHIEDILKDKKRTLDLDKALLVIDRLTCDNDTANINRFAESLETAFFEGNGECIVRFYPEGKEPEVFDYSNRFEMDGMKFEEPSDLMFSFNSPVGACPQCEGYGKVLGIDEDLVIPNKSLSIYDDAVLCWRGEKMGEWKKAFIQNAGKFKFPIHRPYNDLTEEQKDLLWRGAEGVPCIDDFFKMVEENQYKIQYRVMLARYRGKTTCPKCKGSRLKPEALYVKVGDKSIADLVLMPIAELQRFFDQLELNETENKIARRLLLEIRMRVKYLMNVGLSYLTLNRLSNTLSGGETQRISLSTALSSSLVGSLYILDEPSIGLHSRDTDLLINVLRDLTELGNTVVVVEHDEEIIRAADYIIDIGPDAGTHGGEVIYQGDMAGLEKGTDSYTVRYLNGEDIIPVPKHRRKWNNYIEIHGARQNNLKNIDVKFPLNVMTVVTGVSGSGKSSLVCDVLYTAMQHYYLDKGDQIVQFDSMDGDLRLIKNIEMVDQNPIGRSSRSNPVTYIKAYDEIRKLFAEQQLSKQMHYTPAFFSFNMEGGRCEECTGEGFITVEMQFMADVTLECEACKGKRFKQDILEVKYQDASIYDVLEMTIDEAIAFFGKGKGSFEKKITKRLKPLQDVGLGYVKLGQSSSSLSGGENQRVKLAYHLADEKPEPTFFIFDEPTTGLHFHDIKTLLKAFDALVERGHTIVIIEHNMEVIKCADHVIDIGPEGGKAGGNIVCEGKPEKIAKCKESHTGRFLREKLGMKG
ncbi:excinuclease ABC subunit UvrA [Dysgonomonas sp. 25]|uniref:excinuclease ABC subunit UvrA n=1 Tax=Dysgonomonas sp. 25 TaxID=2302933 RepID=UPI0013D20983|nr:excinuclease ABC subunit UvrA [Dysgonomonas sp. 25]NDV70277.1 excinuclease ABC subunit A [Dysgonomonas sp. 25]